MLPRLARLPNYIRTRRYRLAHDPDGGKAATKLTEFNRSLDVQTPRLLILHEFGTDGRSAYTSGLEALVETGKLERAKDIGTRLKKAEVGIWGVRRTYGFGGDATAGKKEKARF